MSSGALGSLGVDGSLQHTAHSTCVFCNSSVTICNHATLTFENGSTAASTSEVLKPFNNDIRHYNSSSSPSPDSVIIFAIPRGPYSSFSFSIATLLLSPPSDSHQRCEDFPRTFQIISTCALHPHAQLIPVPTSTLSSRSMKHLMVSYLSCNAR